MAKGEGRGHFGHVSEEKDEDDGTEKPKSILQSMAMVKKADAARRATQLPEEREATAKKSPQSPRRKTKFGRG